MNIRYTHPQQIKMDNLDHFFFSSYRYIPLQKYTVQSLRMR